MSKAKIATLLVELAAESAQMRKELATAQKSVDRFASRTEKRLKDMDARFMAVGKSLKAGLAGLAVGAASAISTDAIKRTFEWANALQDSADKIGLSTSALQELTLVNAQFGVGAKATETAMQRFSRRVGEAAAGTGELKGTLEQYNIALRNADGSMRSLEAIFSDYTDAVAGAESQQEALRMTVKAFDTEGAGLVNVLRNGSSALADMRQQARDTGAVIDQDLIAQAAAANTEFDAMTAVVGGKLRSLILELTPVIVALGHAIGAAAQAAEIAVKPFSDFFRAIDIAANGSSSIADLRAELAALEQQQADLQRSPISPQYLLALPGSSDLDERIEQLRQLIKNQEHLDDLLSRRRSVDPIAGDAPGNDFSPPPIAAPSVEPLLRLEAEENDDRAGQITEALAAHQNLLDSYQSEIALQGQLSSAAQSSYAIRQQETELLERREAMLAAGVEVGVIDQQIAKLREKQEALNAIERAQSVSTVIEDLERETELQRLSISLLGEDEHTRRAIIGAQEEILYLQERYGELLPEQIEGIKAAYDAAADTARVKQAMEEMIQVGEQLGAAIGDAFVDAAVEGESFNDVLKSLERQMLSILANQFITQPFSNFFGSLVGSIGGGLFGGSAGGGGGGVGIFHNGGAVMGGASIPGLMSDERLAILQTGEYVLSRAMLRELDKFHSGGQVDSYFRAPEFGMPELTAGNPATAAAVANMRAINDNRDYSSVRNVTYNASFHGGATANGSAFGTTPRQMMDGFRALQRREGRGA